MEGNNEVYDVIIVGAGISGSNAAYVLKQRCKNIKILVIEAKNRAGGRTNTIELNCAKPNGEKSKWDVGGQWVCSSQKNVTKLLKDLNIETYDQYDDGRKMLEANGKISSYNSSVPCSSIWSWIDMQLYMKRVNYYLRRIDPVYPYADPKLAKFLESVNLKSFLYSKSFTPTVRSIFTSNMRTIYGLELEQVNTLFGLMLIKAGGGTVEAITYSDEGCAQEKRVKGGTQQIASKCLEQCKQLSNQDSNSFEVLFNTALIHVTQNEQEGDNSIVELLTENTQTFERKTYHARRVISAIPINQYSKIKFTPELPYFKLNFFKYFQVGNYIKFLITYKKAFWREKGFSGEGTFDGSVRWLNESNMNDFFQKESKHPLIYNKKLPKYGAAAEVFDGTNEENQPALVGFVASDAAVEWASLGEDILKKEIVEDLTRMFGPECRDYVDIVVKNWAYEPFNGGCPCFNIVASGVMKDFTRATREPFINLYFGGTESATVWQGYMDGAVESGERCANEIIYSLYRNSDPSIRCDYEKTYFYQREMIKKIQANEEQREKLKQKMKSAFSFIFKTTVLVSGGYLAWNKFKKGVFLKYF